jgi:hypothetical protein
VKRAIVLEGLLMEMMRAILKPLFSVREMLDCKWG